ncbi:GntR family transcriptional regulator [Saccharothrix syringae]|uniref:GntR family transcriptional regulator n=1 Tax=Saccharothrix syringae TaxID=103733 RepID=A0A5Q0H5U8_SACSY|nr:GntR family transcriptional regulator [Saccharothrix syringae]QFZ21576.1 GntR family transcriptional regulator [Saccharothrix syringae]
MTRWTGTPAYAQIANDYRTKIIDGTLPAGAKLPSESELMSRYGVSRVVARQAIGVLRNEGLVDSHSGKGSFVRPRQRVERMARNRYRRHKSTGEFADDARRAGATTDIEAGSARAAAPYDIATRLKIAPNAPVMRTGYRFLANGRPVQVSTSYEPLALTEGTDVERPEEGPLAGRGVINRMDRIGIRVTEVVESVTTRAPLPREVEALDIPPGVHVFTIERTFLADDLPVETCDIVVPGDRYGLTYRIPVVDE